MKRNNRKETEEQPRMTVYEYEEKYSEKTGRKRAKGVLNTVIFVLAVFLFLCAFLIFKEFYAVNRYAGYAAAGILTVPPVSVPIAKQLIPAATAAALPPEEPPGERRVSRGFFVIFQAEVSVELPMANSSMFVFPRITQPAASSLSAAVALYGGR